MEQKKKQKNIKYILRLFIAVIAIVLVVYVCATFLPDIIRLLKEGDEQAMETYIRNMGRMGVLILVLLQILQTITIFFPGIPIYMCAGIVYGKLWGTVICYLTYIVSNVGVFIIVRRLGEAANELLNRNEDKRQTAVAEFMQKTKHPEYLVAALCVVPVVPNGIIPHIASRSSITLKKFFVAVAIGCIPGIFLFVCCGDLLLSEYAWVILALFILVVILMILGVVFKDKINNLTTALLQKFFGEKEENADGKKN